MKKMKKLWRNEDGQAMVMVALMMVVLLGFAALAIDGGRLYIAKSKMQNAADAAALAGAQDLPNASTAINTAVDFAEDNEVLPSNTIVVTPYDSNAKKIKVQCSTPVTFTFGKVFKLMGLTKETTDVLAYAVAQKASWEGEALPFLNVGDYMNEDGTYNSLNIWDKENAGNFERINDYTVVDDDEIYFKIDYSNGVDIKAGKDESVKTPLEELAEAALALGSDHLVYVLSLSQDVIDSNKVLVTPKNNTEQVYRYLRDPIARLNKLTEEDTIDPSQLVLMECLLTRYGKESGQLTLDIGVNKVYPLADVLSGQYPPNYKNPDHNSILVE